MFFRIIEITFASYMVPALLVPVAWIAAWVMKRSRRWSNAARVLPLREVEGQSRLLFWLFLVWLVLLLAVVAGVPLNRGGPTSIVLCWAVYVVTNMALAWFLLRFTVTYGSIPRGRTADRAFMRFIAIVVAQPLMTAAAFAVLNNVMGVAWNAHVPELPAVQEGI